MTAASATAGWASRTASSSAGATWYALYFDHLLEPVDDVEIAVIVHIADIARAEPAIGIDRAGGRVRTVEIPLHHLRAAHPELTRFVRPEINSGHKVNNPAFRIGHDGTDRAELVGLAWHRHGVSRRARLRHPVHLGDRAADPVLAAPGELTVERGGSGPDLPQARQVVLVDGRGIGKHQHDGRDHERVRHPVVLDGVEHHREFEVWREHQGSAMVQSTVKEPGSIKVGEGSGTEDDVVTGDAKRGATLRDIGHKTAMGDHHALRQPRRPARIGKQHDLLHVDRHLRHDSRIRQQVRKTRRARRLANHERLADRGRVPGRLRLVEQRRRCQQVAGPGVGKLRRKLAARCQRAHRGDDSPEGGDREQRDGVLDGIRRVDAQHIALAEAPLRQSGGNRPHISGERLVRHGCAGRGVHQRGSGSVPIGITEHKRCQRHGRDGDVREGAAEDHGARLLMVTRRARRSIRIARRQVVADHRAGRDPPPHRTGDVNPW